MENFQIFLLEIKLFSANLRDLRGFFSQNCDVEDSREGHWPLSNLQVLS